MIDIKEVFNFSMVYTFFDKETSGRCIKNENIPNKELAKDFHKPIIRKSNKRKVLSSFIDNIWGADLADMQLIIKCNKELKFLLCVIDIYSKYAWVIPLKDKKSITITNAFQNFLKESSGKANKIWVDKGNEFYKRSAKSWLEKMILKCVQRIMKVNLLFLKDSLEFKK